MSGYQGYNPTGDNDGGFSRNITSNGDESSQGRNYARSNSITPVTIKQINEATQQGDADGPYYVNNVELNLVSFVGIVRGTVDNTSNVVVKVEDGTGEFEFRYWLNESTSPENDDGDKEMKDSDDETDLQLHKYVYVTGALKQFNEKKTIQHPTYRLIKDYNEVLYHYLSAIQVHVEAQGVGIKPKAEMNNLFVSNPASEETDVNSKILKVIKDNTPSMPDGVPLQYIQQKVNVDLPQIMAACSSLEEDAKIYLGVEENTYLFV